MLPNPLPSEPFKAPVDPRLPIIDLPASSQVALGTGAGDRGVRRGGNRWLMVVFRLIVLGLIAWGVQGIQQRSVERAEQVGFAKETASTMLGAFPAGAELGDEPREGSWQVVDATGEPIGRILRTAPQSQPIVGFSGPTHSLIAVDRSDRILRVSVQQSFDTRDHIQLVIKDPSFLAQWNGLSLDELKSSTRFDGVSGATLTSSAIYRGLQKRLGAQARTGQFDDPVSLETAQVLFPESQGIERDPNFDSRWQVLDGYGRELGWLLRTSPVADAVVGYQGPSDTVIGFTSEGRVVGIVIGQSFDNEPYVGYVRRDRWFASIWKEQSWPELTQMDLREAGVEGVSGATMSSMAIARSLLVVAKEHAESLEAYELRKAAPESWWSRLASNWNALGVVLVTLVCLLFAISRWKGNRWGRLTVQAVVIFYLGFYQCNLLSIAMFGGWVQNGVPWASAAPLVLLAVISLAMVAVFKRNVYCSHLCPYGAVQQLMPRWWKLQAPYPRWLKLGLEAIRPLLFLWILCVVGLLLPGNLVDIEPFDAFAWKIAAIPSLLVALSGILLSFRIPMGYCQFGCPTGSLLNYLRGTMSSRKVRPLLQRNANSKRSYLSKIEFNPSDIVAVVFLLFIWTIGWVQ